MRALLALCIILLPASAPAQMFETPPLFANPPGTALALATASAKKNVCDVVERRFSCERDFDRLLARAREITSLENMEFELHMSDDKVRTKDLGREIGELRVEFRLHLRAILVRYMLPEV